MMIHFMDFIMCVGRSLDPVRLFLSAMGAQGDGSVGIFVTGDCFQPCWRFSSAVYPEKPQSSVQVGTLPTWSFFGPGECCKYLLSFCQIPVIESQFLVFASSFIFLYRELKVGQTWGSRNTSILIAELHLCKAGFFSEMRNYCCHLLPLHAAGLFLGHNHRARISRCVGSPVFFRSLLSWVVIDKCQLSGSFSRWVLTYRLSYLCFGGVFFWLFSFSAIQCSWS